MVLDRVREEEEPRAETPDLGMREERSFALGPVGTEGEGDPPEETLSGTLRELGSPEWA